MRDIQDSIDKRNASIMELEARYRAAIAALEMFVAWEDGKHTTSPAAHFAEAITAARAVIKLYKKPRGSGWRETPTGWQRDTLIT